MNWTVCCLCHLLIIICQQNTKTQFILFYQKTIIFDRCAFAMFKFRLSVMIWCHLQRLLLSGPKRWEMTLQYNPWKKIKDSHTPLSTYGFSCFCTVSTVYKLSCRLLRTMWWTNEPHISHSDHDVPCFILVSYVPAVFSCT